MGEIDLEARKLGVGGSDAPIVMGVSPYKTAYQLWKEKTGIAIVPDLSSEERVRWGNLHESTILKEYAHRRSLDISSPLFAIHPQHSWMNGNIDGSYSEHGEPVGVEIKTVDKDVFRSFHWGRPGTEEIPLHYMMQVQHYMGVTGWKSFDVVALVGGNEMMVYPIARNDFIIDEMIAAESEFWQHVQTKTEPMSKSTEEARQKFPTGKPNTNIETSEDVLHIVMACKAIKSNIKQDKERLDALESKIMEYMGNHEKLTSEGRTIASWTDVASNVINTKALKEDYPSLVLSYIEHKSARRFTLK